MNTQPLRHVCGEIVHRDGDGNYHPRHDRDCITPAIDSCPVCKYPLEDGWFRPLHRIEPMSRGMMERTITGNYACSNCWGYAFTVINVPPDPEDEDGETLYHVLCVECKEETIGFVSGNYVERSRDDDFRSYVAVERTLAAAMGIERPKEERRSAEQNLHELGF